MKLSEEDYRELYSNIEAILLAIQTDSYRKKLKHDYMIPPKDFENFDQIYFILCAAVRQHTEKLFDRYIDAELSKQVREIVDARKKKFAGRGRKKAEDKITIPDKEPVRKSSVGKFRVESYDD